MWARTFCMLLEDWLKGLKLNPYKLAGTPRVEVYQRPERRAHTVTITFDVVPE